MTAPMYWADPAERERFEREHPEPPSFASPPKPTAVAAEVAKAIAGVKPANTWVRLANYMDNGGDTVRDYLAMRRPRGSCWLKVVHRSGDIYEGECGKWNCSNGKGSGGYCTEHRAMKLARQAAGEWEGRRILVVEGEENVDQYLTKHKNIRLKSRAGYTIRKGTQKGTRVAGYDRTPGTFKIQGWDTAWLFVPDERGTDDMEVLGEALAEAILGQRISHRVPSKDEDVVPYRVTIPTGWSEAMVNAAKEWTTVRESRHVRRAKRRPTEDEWVRFVRRVRGLEPIPRTEPVLTLAGMARAPTDF